MTTRPTALLLIVAREPTPGQTKTRLGAAIGMEAAATLYRAFLTDLAGRFGPRPGVDVGWAYCPATCDFRALLARLAGRPLDPSVLFVPQAGKTFNDRLTNLFRWATEHGYERTAVMASDSPQLCPDEVATVFPLLERHDVALGRVHDGGYYLIGQRGFRDLLTDLPMSTANAADAVVERAGSWGLTVGELPCTYDVDVIDDLSSLRQTIAEGGAGFKATRAALDELGFLAVGPITMPALPTVCP